MRSTRQRMGTIINLGLNKPAKIASRLRMEILWLAIVFYSIGLGLVLHFKPRLMFNDNGTWKEFGYQAGPRHTLFPVWLFAIAWAVVSYALASVIRWTYLGPAAAGASAMLSSGRIRTAFGQFDDMAEEEALQNIPMDEVAEEEEEEAEAEESSLGQRVSETIRIPRGRTVRPQTPARKPRSGYYVLDPQSKSGDGLRKYIYYGEAPPPELGARGVSV